MRGKGGVVEPIRTPSVQLYKCAAAASQSAQPLLDLVAAMAICRLLAVLLLLLMHSIGGEEDQNVVILSSECYTSIKMDVLIYLYFMEGHL